MPVLKGHTFQSSSRETIVLDLGDLGRQAAKLREAAERQAAGIIDRARIEAEHKSQQAQDEAHAKGFEAGHAEGHANGLAQGKAEAFNEAKQQLTALQSAWTSALHTFDSERKLLRQEAETAVLRLALQLAGKVLHRAVEVEPGRVVDQARAALSYVLEPTSVRIALHPDDRALVESAMPGLIAGAVCGCDITMEDDAAITRGGCVVKHPQGAVDATLQTQLHRLTELLMPGFDTAAHAGAASDDTLTEGGRDGDV